MAKVLKQEHLTREQLAQHAPKKEIERVTHSLEDHINTKNFGEGSSVILEVRHLVSELQEFVENNFRQEEIHRDEYNNPIIKILQNTGDQVRVSTAIIFESGEKTAYIDRSKIKQANQNTLNDIFGAVTFNNSSLPFKVPKEFQTQQILSLFVDHEKFAYEQTNEEDDAKHVIMIIIRAQVSEKAIKLLESENISVVNKSELTIDSATQTSKLQAAIKGIKRN